MEGGMTRHRAYLWLTAALLLVLLVLIWTHHSTTISTLTAPAEMTAQQPAADTPYYYQGHTATRHSHPSTLRRTAAPTTVAHTPEQPPATIYKKDKQLVFNLNEADSLDLVQLYNIGPTFARRIIRYRTLLGGYVDIRQLWEVRGMDSVRYNDIAPYLYADPADITKIDLNSATLEQLKRHPYLDYYQAKAIVQLRDASGPYSTTEDLLKIPIIDNETYTHIAPYLTCNSQPNK